jgi:hypothetical protein
VVCEHEAAYTVVGRDIRRSTRKRDLDGGGAPGYEVRQLSLPYAQ